MSAINPASFASPSIGLAPSGVGPGVAGPGVVGARSSQAERRPQSEQSNFGNPQPSRSYPSSFTPQSFQSPVDRGAIPPTFQSSGYTYGYSPFGTAPRNVGVSPGGYGSMIDPFAPFPASTDYQGIPGRFPSPHTSASNHDGGEYGRQSNGLGTPNENWIGAFQGLSMNSR